MLGTYASALLVVAAAAAVGQAAFVLCGRREWSWLAPATGLALLLVAAWLAVRLPGEGTAALVLVGALTLAALAFLGGRTDGLRGALRVGLPVAGFALLAASLPFIAEARFGILGTGLNPDMSQHLFAADRLAEPGTERLISSGYPLGPHAIAVALATLGPSLVEAFAGIAIATAVIAALTPLALVERLAAWRRIAAALLVGFAYMSAAYFVQGAFKETLQALFVLAFAIGLGELARGRLAGPGAARAIPLALIAAGSLYAYSFPGLVWIGGAAMAWGLAELVAAGRHGRADRARGIARTAIRPAAVAIGVLAIAAGPELGRMVDFARFETFDPEGAGLGNLFNPISPLEALGIWPSGDFRLDPGAGFAPAIAFWAGGLLGLAALAVGLWWWLRRGEHAVPAALGVAGLLIAYAHVAGTPYQEAKAIAMAAPLAMLTSIRALAELAPPGARVARTIRRRDIAQLLPRTARRARLGVGVAALALAFTAGAGGSTLLALANGPVGPSSWSPALIELRPLDGATLVVAPADFLGDEHGRDLVVWELRGGEVCVEARDGPDPDGPPPGIRQVVVLGHSPQPPFAGTADPQRAGAYTLWTVTSPAPGPSGCPFIADGARADPSG